MENLLVFDPVDEVFFSGCYSTPKSEDFMEPDDFSGRPVRTGETIRGNQSFFWGLQK
jgi:hypothetical protein